MNNPSNSLDTAINELVNIVQRLRDPKTGCPWDIEQTHTSLIPFLIEEAHEVADAIREENSKGLKEELGDLLLQVVLHSQIASEEKKFNFTQVIEEISQKLIRRHPHIFHKREKISIDQVKLNWARIKASEKKHIKSFTPFSDQIKEKVRSQSATNGALLISKIVAKVGLEWEESNQIWSKLYEELDELKEALKANLIKEAEIELGDVFFTLINIARWYNLNAEEGLIATNKKLLKRVAYIEKKSTGEITSITPNKMQEYWQDSKKFDSI